MGDSEPIVRGAVVQAAPVFLDREATLEKAVALIHEAGANGAEIVAFPEGFIPAHPIWFHFHSGTDRHATALSVELFKNSVEIPGPHIDALVQAAAEAGTYVVMGVCEKISGTFGSMYNTQVFISPTDGYVGKHQKLMPTVGERLVHRPGGPDTFGVFPSSFGPVSGLMCGENSNPLAIFALTAEATRVHAMAWPNHFPKPALPMPEISLTAARAFAQMSKAWVLSASAVVDDRIREMVPLNDTDLEYLARDDIGGGSCIVAPDTRVVAGPAIGNEELILYADMDLEVGVKMKLRHDLSGHYNRPDVFRLLVNKRSAPLIQSIEDGISATPPMLETLEPPMLEPRDFDDES
ncbi:MAG TPA: carbon-nitrogen hydrolase family protein [Acidimicrobiia bacterium]|jgi:aliphatic nitrilase